MKLFTCPTCFQVLHFENTLCERCGHRLAYLPDLQMLTSLEPLAESGAQTATTPDFVALAPEASARRVRLCRNYADHDACNWAVPAESQAAFCQSCALNEVIPNLGTPEARQAWVRLETAKRRLIYSLLALGLPFESQPTAGALVFAFKASTDAEPVFTGHRDGVITINVEEASNSFREKTREQMGEPYRTVLGHFRHEAGHYYWDRLIRGSHRLEPFRALFGNETLDYAGAQRGHYEQGPPADWAAQFVSVYASMHPWEDWAETFAHYLHMVDTLETARAYGLALAPGAVSGAPLPSVATRRLQFDAFNDLIGPWFPLTNALNSLNRSMGLADLYPFVLSDRAIAKLRFVHDVIAAGDDHGTAVDASAAMGSAGVR